MGIVFAFAVGFCAGAMFVLATLMYLNGPIN